MSHTQSGAIARCTVAGLNTTHQAALSVQDYLANHPDESIESSDNIAGYLDCQSDGKLTICYDTEDHNCDSMVFDFLASYFARLQSSFFMEVHWWVNDSRGTSSAGTDYYDKQNNLINVPEILNNYLAAQS